MKTVHLVLFMGQSNMAGRGEAEEAPGVSEEAGYEYRAVSDTECLYQIEEPFGAAENDKTGVYEPGMKTGSMVSAFVNAYYEAVKIPVVGVSCSKGGSSIAEWMQEVLIIRMLLEEQRDAVSGWSRMAIG